MDDVRELVEVFTAHPAARYWNQQEAGLEQPVELNVADVLDRIADGLFAVAKAVRGLSVTS